MVVRKQYVIRHFRPPPHLNPPPPGGRTEERAPVPVEGEGSPQPLASVRSGDSLEVDMDWKLLLTVFSTIFIAEIGDKTQLATLLYASGAEVNKLTVFFGASLALILTSALGVLVGSALAQYVNPRYLAWVAGIGFIAVGIWTIVKA
jgi:putative Ca2+/H+ antiporter (TMEM165/GDT1 family)